MSTRRGIVAALVVLCLMSGGLVFGGSLAFAGEYAPGPSFGSSGSGNGQFQEPTSLAVNEVAVGAVGDVYVIDRGNARVERLSTEGVYLSQWNGGTTHAGSFAFSRGTQAVAVDNSSEPLDPSAGDVYVVDAGHDVIDQFTAEGVPTGLEITGTCPHAGVCAAAETIPFSGQLRGVAVDPKGNLWVSDEANVHEFNKGSIDEFSDTGLFEQSVTIGRTVEAGFGVDSTGNLYAGNYHERISKYDGAGRELFEFGKEVSALTITPGSSEVLLDQQSSIALYGPFGEPNGSPVQVFTDPSLESGRSQGVAVDGARKIVYASESANNEIATFDWVPFPSVTTEASSEAEGTKATFHGTIDPEGQEITACRFEYGQERNYGEQVEYEYSAACKQTPAQINALSAGGTKPVAVSAEAAGLLPRSGYGVRLSATSASGTWTGAGIKMYTVDAPLIEEEVTVSTSSDEAVVGAKLDTGGLATTYRVDYGRNVSYESSTPDVNIGAPQHPVKVRVSLTGLAPGNEYHFRLVANNALGVGDGVDSTFDTSGNVGAVSSVLPDGRVYEAVSPVVSAQNVYDPDVSSYMPEEDLEDNAPVRAAENGNAVTYTGEPSAEGGNGAYGKGQANQFLATRSANGWSARDVTPSTTDANTKYRFFSPDLAIGVLNSSVPIPSASPVAPAKCFGLYTHMNEDDSYQSLFTEVNDPAECKSRPEIRGVSTGNGVHTLFSSPAALTSGSHPGELYEEELEENLYESFDGVVRQVNVLPDGKPEASPDASAGAPGGDGEIHPNLSGAISVDGSRVFWTKSTYNGSGSYTPDALYVRENDAMPQSPLGPNTECTVSSDACTVQIDAGEQACVLAGKCGSGGGRFWGASADGSRVFFTDCAKLTAVTGSGCDLYEYKLESRQLTDLTVGHSDPAGAEVQGVLGISEDGAYVYFVADGVLAPGAQRRTCTQSNDTSGEEEELRQEQRGLLPAHHGCNLYVLHNGEITFIGTLLYADNNLEPLFGSDASPRGDWRGSMGERTAEVTPDGHSLVFVSTSPLTGYRAAGFREVFVYNAPARNLACVSCDPSGAPPSVGSPENGFGAVGAYLPVMWMFGGSAFMERFISEDGSRVFFETQQPILPQASNGLLNVYEWEREGIGSCPSANANGCLYLLSGGSSTDNAYLLDADAKGENAFFTGREALVPGTNGKIVLYDARVGGGFPETSTACSGTGCQGVPPAPPIFATPSSVTYAGIGNFAAPVNESVAKKRSGKTTKCKSGSVRRRSQCVKKAGKKVKVKRAHARSGGKVR